MEFTDRFLPGRAEAPPSRMSGLSLAPSVFLTVKIKHMHRRALGSRVMGDIKCMTADKLASPTVEHPIVVVPRR